MCRNNTLRDIDKLLVQHLGDLYLSGKIYLNISSVAYNIYVIGDIGMRLKVTALESFLHNVDSTIKLHIIAKDRLPDTCIKWTSLKLEDKIDNKEYES